MYLEKNWGVQIRVPKAPEHECQTLRVPQRKMGVFTTPAGPAAGLLDVSLVVNVKHAAKCNHGRALGHAVEAVLG